MNRTDEREMFFIGEKHWFGKCQYASYYFCLIGEKRVSICLSGLKMENINLCVQNVLETVCQLCQFKELGEKLRVKWTKSKGKPVSSFCLPRPSAQSTEKGKIETF